MRGHDTAATRSLSTAATRIAVAPAEAATRALHQRAGRAADAGPAAASTRAGAARRKRRGAWIGQFLALTFIFFLIAVIVAGIVVLNLDNSEAHRVVRDVTDWVQNTLSGLNN